MNFDLWHHLAMQHPLVYKIWIENDGNPIPPEYLRYLNRRKPRGSQVVLWSSQAGTNTLLSKHRNRFPGIYDLFWAQNTSAVMRSDILRLLLVFDRGGIYSDHDAVWKRQRLPCGPDFIVWTEFVLSDETVRKNMEMTREHRCDLPEYNVRIGNYVFMSRKPHSRILGRCLNRVQKRMRKNAHAPLSQYGVLYSTGPDVMTDTLVDGLPDSATLKPFEKCEWTNTEWIDRDGEHVLLMGRQPGKAIVQHEMYGEWRASHAKKD